MPCPEENFSMNSDEKKLIDEQNDQEDSVDYQNDQEDSVDYQNDQEDSVDYQNDQEDSVDYQNDQEDSVDYQNDQEDSVDYQNDQEDSVDYQNDQEDSDQDDQEDSVDDQDDQDDSVDDQDEQEDSVNDQNEQYVQDVSKKLYILFVDDEPIFYSFNKEFLHKYCKIFAAQKMTKYLGSGITNLVKISENLYNITIRYFNMIVSYEKTIHVLKIKEIVDIFNCRE
jgi:hypothetical protein